MCGLLILAISKDKLSNAHALPGRDGEGAVLFTRTRKRQRGWREMDEEAHWRTKRSAVH